MEQIIIPYQEHPEIIDELNKLLIEIFPDLRCRDHCLMHLAALLGSTSIPTEYDQEAA